MRLFFRGTARAGGEDSEACMVIFARSPGSNKGKSYMRARIGHQKTEMMINAVWRLFCVQRQKSGVGCGAMAGASKGR